MANKTDILNNVEQIDVLATDVVGQLQAKTFPVRAIPGKTQEERVASLLESTPTFDSSSLRGMNDIDQSDMTDPIDKDGIIVKDPFRTIPTALVFSDIREPETIGGAPYHKDPRGVAKRAEAYLKSTGIGTTAYYGPEIEFFLFDSIRVKADANRQILEYCSKEGAWTDEFHKVNNKLGYFPKGSWDKTTQVRDKALKYLEEMGIEGEAHHHEVATAGQAEINMRFDSLVNMADKTQLYKYVVRKTAEEYGMTAVFLPKPLPNDNGSGMHTNMSIYKEDTNVFAGNIHGGLSIEGLWAVGGILAHIGAISAFANPTTNSSRRFAKGFEAPILAVYGARNRSAAIRIPSYHTSPKVKRLEARFPDPMANPYLLNAAFLCAMVDGIQRKIDPGAPMEHDVYELGIDALRKLPAIPRSLDARLETLYCDRKFLTASGVFNDAIIDSFIDKATGAAAEVDKYPSPREIEVYAGWN